MTINTTHQRIAVLDGLRAIAIILVLMRHGVRPFWYDFSKPFLKVGPIEFGNAFINGWIGVDLFFVLSGFLIASQLLGTYYDQNTGRMDILSYAKRRFLRIAPVYYFALTVVIIGLIPLYPYPESRENLPFVYGYHLLFLQDYWPSYVVAAFWSLAIEIKFYLLAPFLLLGFLKLPAAWRVFVLLVLIATQPFLRMIHVQDMPPVIDYLSFFINVRSKFHLCLDGLLAGVLCAVIYTAPAYRRFIERRAIANGLFGLGLAGFLLISLDYVLVDLGASRFEQVWLSSAVAGSFACIMLGLLGGCDAVKFFAWKGWTFPALISYSLYLWHMPVMYMAEAMAKSAVDFNMLSLQVQMLVYAPFYIGLATLAATVSYYFIERPFLRRR
jgi:peptidoglycan/LPS O-acetylase OafA/YrhL